MASEVESKQNDVVAFELRAPVGWVKKLTPKKSGTPKRNVIVFISPTGEEIKNKRQLDQYLKSHPGGPAASEFDWGTGDTPRRSSRLSEKSKASDASQSTSKRRKKLSTKEAGEESTDDGDGEEVMGEKNAAGEEIKGSADMGTKEAVDGEAVTEGAIPEKPDTENAEMKENEEPSAVGTKNEADTVLEGAEIEEFKEGSKAEEIQDGKVDFGDKDSIEKQEAEKPVEEIKGSADMDTKEAVNGEAVTEEAISERPDTENAEMKENEEPSAVGTKNDANTVVDGAEIEESKEGSKAEEIQDGKVDFGDKDNSEGKQEAEKPVENEDVLQEPTTGS
ncbi:hypothetical protein OROGR_024678 [Orobanche gracilis]